MKFQSLLIVCSLLLLFSTKPSSSNQNELRAIKSDNAQVEKIVGGYKFLEGPLWHPDGFLLFSDTPANTIYKLSSNGKVEVFRRPAGYLNGNALDREGRLVTAQHDRSVTRTEKDGKVVTLATHYSGKKLNSPNDIVVKSDNSIYFTDPPFGIRKPYAVQEQPEELGFSGVYRLTEDGQLTLLVKDMELPNGLAFSPDEKHLYINDSQEGNIRVFDVKADGTLTNSRVFADLNVPGERLADGMKVDLQGNVYSTGPKGIWIFSPQGKLLGKISVPEGTTNIAWGGKDYKTLYITTYTSLYQIPLNVAGVAPSKE
ncbi:SMP-30/gluconolactonase/LRE family protein [Gloeocapsopsis sp. IPPAS B-1203]|uniref:SMP-30/gluconolactonase/LRE family protein n=1 Tax=Gloeocapsopsis sp. IPPAS B-1203 TaxID=2049454 RepID=UPI000C1758AD|nr:SMP-30/gluconolactonase/LRE family protein [Gloeocapsopsis sp. IPPAS B-1203]PIG91693.1 gluconolactonase [Gloeocapsopsis sp. IPPAS B-1203]